MEDSFTRTQGIVTCHTLPLRQILGTRRTSPGGHMYVLTGGLVDPCDMCIMNARTIRLLFPSLPCLWMTSFFCNCLVVVSFLYSFLHPLIPYLTPFPTHRQSDTPPCSSSTFKPANEPLESECSREKDNNQRTQQQIIRRRDLERKKEEKHKHDEE